MKTKLEVGDVIYEVNVYGDICKHVVERVTKTQGVICGDFKFRIDISSYGTVSFIGVTFGSATFYIATPELDAKYEFQLLMSEVRNIHRAKLTTDQLKRILEIAKEGHGE